MSYDSIRRLISGMYNILVLHETMKHKTFKGINQFRQCRLSRGTSGKKNATVTFQLIKMHS
jgi:hypothetical protein